MSDKTKNIVNVKGRILAFSVAKELKTEDLKTVSGAGKTHGWVTAPTGPNESYDHNEYIFDYEH